MPVLGFDISSYQDHIPAGVWSFGIAKNDSMGERHLKSMQDRGIKYTILYGWIDELASVPAQVDNLITNAHKWGASGIADDDEQWWSSWAAYMGSLNHTYSGVVPALTPDHISNDFKQAAQLSKASGLPYVTYTASWVEERAPLIASWLGSYDLWNACYFDRNVGGTYKVTTDQLQQIINNLDNLPVLVEILKHTSVPKKIASPNVMPAGATSYKFRQFSSRIILPGETENVDLDIFNGTEAELAAYFGGVSVPIPAPVPQVRIVNCDYLAAHQQPDLNSAAIGWFTAGDVTNILAANSEWSQTAKGWVKSSYLQRI